MADVSKLQVVYVASRFIRYQLIIHSWCMHIVAYSSLRIYSSFVTSCAMCLVCVYSSSIYTIHLSIQHIYLYNTYQFILDLNMVHSVYRISNDELDRLTLQFDIYTIHSYNTYQFILDLNMVHSVVHSVFIATPSTMCDVSIHRLFIH